ncbi:helix-turn-helix domain-containing protein [Rhizobium leguminosarum]|uniref:Insertion element IS150 protein InsJ-like helix-turn-helix domain-containing protein n=1 Tax=Rhizobium leguminosarum TaxID=384 RepID=A0A2K9Z9M7_RHILE|nr:helix-turn-helix domain-containing protein [Rhizobium leguminosarum]AUW44965.1 hypothetical protein CUJ84_Chr004661 [Rhizobium leguminosarum]
MDERLEFCRLAALEGENVSELCQRHGITRQTGYVWLRRLRAGEPVGGDCSHRPHATHGAREPISSMRLQDLWTEPPSATTGVGRSTIWLRLDQPNASI